MNKNNYMRKYCYCLLCIFSFFLTETNLTSQQIVEPQWILPVGRPLGFTDDRSQVYFETPYGIGFSNSIYELPEVFNSGKPFENPYNKYFVGMNGKYVLYNTYNTKAEIDSASELHVWDVGVKKKLYTLRFFGASYSMSRTDKYLNVMKHYTYDTAFIYDLPTGKLVKKISTTIERQSGFSPNDEYFYIIDSANILRVWKTNTWEYLSVFESMKIKHVDFSSDGSKIAVVEKDSTKAKIFETANMRQIKSLKYDDMYDEYLSLIKFNKDATRLVVVSNLPPTIMVWDVEKESLVSELPSFAGCYDAEYIVLGGKDYIASFTRSWAMNIYDVSSRKLVCTYDNLGPDAILRNCPEDELYIYNYYRHEIYKWTNKNKQLHIDTIFCLGSLGYNYWYESYWGGKGMTCEVDSNHLTLMYGSKKQKIDIEKRKIVSTSLEKRGSLRLKNGRYALFVNGLYYEVWDIIEEKKMYEMEIYGWKTPMALSSDGRKVACTTYISNYGYGVTIYDVSIKEVTIETDSRGIKLEYIKKLVFNQKGDKLLILQGSKIDLWDQNLKDSVIVLHNGYCINAIFSHNDRYVTVAEDKNVVVVDIEAKVLKFKLEHESGLKGFYGSPKKVVYNDSNTLVATYYYDNNIYIWNAFSGEKITTLLHTYPISNVTFSEKNRHIIASSTDGNVYMWDIDKSKLLTVLHAEMDTLTYAEYSRDESKIIAYSIKSQVGCVIWDIGKTMTDISQENIETDGYCSIIPNPSNNSVTVIVGNGRQNNSSYTVFSSLGEKVLYGALSEGNTPLTLDTSTLLGGIYFFTTEINGKKVQEKFVVVR